MDLAVHLKERHLAFDVPPLYAKVGFAREIGGFDRHANIALVYGQREIRLIRALGLAMRRQRRLPRVAIYDNTVQVVCAVEHIVGELRAAIAKLRMPPLQKVIEACSVVSAAHFTPDEDFATFMSLYTKERRYVLEIYGPRGTGVRSFEAFDLAELGSEEMKVLF